MRKPETHRGHEQVLPSVSQPRAAVQDEQPPMTLTPVLSDPGTGQVFPAETPDIMGTNRRSLVPTYRTVSVIKWLFPPLGFRVACYVVTGLEHLKS